MLYRNCKGTFRVRNTQHTLYTHWTTRECSYLTKHNVHNIATFTGWPIGTNTSGAQIHNNIMIIIIIIIIRRTGRPQSDYFLRYVSSPPLVTYCVTTSMLHSKILFTRIWLRDVINVTSKRWRQYDNIRWK